VAPPVKTKDTNRRHREVVQTMGSALGVFNALTSDIVSRNLRQVRQSSNSSSRKRLRAVILAQDTHLAADQGIKDSSVHWQADVTRFYFTSPFLI
jgi:lysylphosphatidylglycerol synthetase-like protein (DUF2156 family)